LPTKVITLLINAHGEDNSERFFIPPKNVRIVSAAGETGCINFATVRRNLTGMKTDKTLENMLADIDFIMQLLTIEDVPTLLALQGLQSKLKANDKKENKSFLPGLLERTCGDIPSGTRQRNPGFRPTSECMKRLRERTMDVNFNKSSRFDLIAPVVDHEYVFEERHSHAIETGNPFHRLLNVQGVYVLDSRNNDAANLKSLDNLAEERFDLKGQKALYTPVSSTHDLNAFHRNYARRALGEWGDLASLLFTYAEVSPFTNGEDLDRWLTSHMPTEQPMFRFAVKQLLEMMGTEDERKVLKCLLCAKKFGTKYLQKNRQLSTKKGDTTLLVDIPEVLQKVLPNIVKLIDSKADDKPEFGLTEEEVAPLKDMFAAETPDFATNIENALTICNLTRLQLPMEIYANTAAHTSVGQVDYQVQNSQIGIFLSEIISYLRGCGYDGINIIDLSCRVHFRVDDAAMQKITERERQLTHPFLGEWGGRARKTSKRRRSCRKRKNKACKTKRRTK
jgi:hypothetical protein